MSDPVITEAGLNNAKLFFDRCDTDPIMRRAVMSTNESIVALAASHSLAFSYEEMQAHLRARWGVTNAPHDFCCT
jgi:hypothetical protein